MNWMRFRWIYFLISAVALSLSFYSILSWGFKQSIDFTGGTVVEYKLPRDTGVDKLKEVAQEKNIPLKDVRDVGHQSVEAKFTADFTQEEAQELANSLPGGTQILKFETVGPTLSAEILKKTYVALAIAAVGILIWVAWQFKSLQFGVSAILATLHDTIIILGTFAAIGYFKGVEVDILFVTAVLTVLSFSVHDTIVVYDRIRESTKKLGHAPMLVLANKAVSETMVRSLNNSLTIIFMLVALFLLGGATIKWFVFALLVGTVSGTYSSPFVAVPLLVIWDEVRARLKK